MLLDAVHPFDRIALKKLLKQTPKGSDYEVDPFTAAERDALLKAARPDEAPMMRFWFNSGLRPGELMALQWSRIDWIGRKTRIDENLVAGITKGQKTEASVRDVELNGGSRGRRDGVPHLRQVHSAGLPAAEGGNVARRRDRRLELPTRRSTYRRDHFCRGRFGQCLPLVHPARLRRRDRPRSCPWLTCATPASKGLNVRVPKVSCDSAGTWIARLTGQRQDRLS